NVSAFVFPAFASPGNTVQYFLSQQNAEDGVNPIAATFYNTTAGSQTVFIKIDNGLCHTIQPVDLIVRFFNSVPAAQLVQCDYGANPDGISVFNLSEADVLFTGSDPAFVVQYFENAAALAANSPLSPTYTNLTNPQNVVVKITDGVTGCSSSNTLTLKVNTVTAQSITGLAKCSDNGFVQFDLTDANVVISPQETAAYYPSLNDALLQMNQIANVSSYTNPVAFHSSVFVRIDDSVNGCSGISEITLDINPLPAIDLTDEAYICANQPGAEVQIDAGLLPSGQGFTFIWKFATMLLPDTTYSISATQVGTYTVDITNAIGCTNTRAILVQPADVATIQSITADGNSPNANSVTINLTPASVGNFGYSIDQPNGPFQAGNYFPAISCGRHIAYVDGGNGCGASSFAFEIMGIPSYFSPNNDGFADRWNITCGENHPATTLYIFDRFGKLIKEIGAAGLGWDGTLNGQPMPSDDYWYILNSDDGKTSKGHFALKR
ncbi:MAG: T9SS type B sorting domain-containing protein, partial [Flavobacterium sp.]